METFCHRHCCDCSLRADRMPTGVTAGALARLDSPGGLGFFSNRRPNFIHLSIYIQNKKTYSKSCRSFWFPDRDLSRSLLARLSWVGENLPLAAFLRSVAHISSHLAYNPFESLQKTENPPAKLGDFLVPGQGFEPRLPGPKPGVLPLDDPGSNNTMWGDSSSF